MRKLKYFADLLTFSRLLVATALVVFGLLLGPETLPYASLLVVYAWFSDIMDGLLARRSQVNDQTWIGNNDLYIDMSVAAGLAVYLTAASFIKTSVTIAYVIFWFLMFWRYGIASSFGKLFQAPIYGWFLLITFVFEPIIGVIFVLFLLAAVVLTWPRFPEDTIPEFLSGFKETHSRKEVNDVLEDASNSMDKFVYYP